MAYPILAPNSTWYKSTQARSTITEINVVDSYTPTSYDEVWNADVNNSGSIKCYRTGTVITMAGNGSGKIAMNADSSFAFALSGGTGFTNLTKITSAGLFDTSNVTTMSRMFQKAGKLIEVDVSNWDTSKVEIMANLFDRTGLTAVAIDNWDVSNVREMNAMFQSCTSLQSLNVSTWDVGRVTTMRNMFNGCQSLNSLDVSNWNVGNVTNMHQMFWSCDSLTTLDVSNWDTGKVTDMFCMFESCRALTTLGVSNVSNWDVSHVTNMTALFHNCERLAALDVSNWDVGNVTDMRSMFSMSNYGAEKSALTSLDVSNWNVSKCTDMGWMFYGCNGIDELDVSKWDVSNVDSLHHFIAHSYITLNGLENWRPSKCRAFNAALYSAQNKTLDLSGWDVSNGITFSQMFEGSAVEEIIGLENWNTSNGGSFSEMFLNCSKLRKLDLSSFNTHNASTSWTDEWRDNTEHGDMDYMFTGMSRLEKITFGENFSFNGDGTCTAAVLPTPDATYITGADGNWYDLDGDAFAPADIPTTTAATYYASKDVCDVNYSINHMTLIDLAKAVRAVTGSTEKLTPGEMATALNSMT